MKFLYRVLEPQPELVRKLISQPRSDKVFLLKKHVITEVSSQLKLSYFSFLRSFRRYSEQNLCS